MEIYQQETLSQLRNAADICPPIGVFLVASMRQRSFKVFYGMFRMHRPYGALKQLVKPQMPQQCEQSTCHSTYNGENLSLSRQYPRHTCPMRQCISA